MVYRTHADPRFLDLSLDPNDRAVGSVWGKGADGARAVNYAASQMGRITSLTAWMPQWVAAQPRRWPGQPGAHLGAGAVVHLYR